jgi:hypothetical protein
MTSRERVWAAVSHREPDRVPVDLGGSIVTGINAMAYGRLREHLGLEPRPVRVGSIILLLAEVEPVPASFPQGSPLSFVRTAPGSCGRTERSCTP